MTSAREMRVRIRSIKNLAQVTKALETVSASKVRKAVLSVEATRPYAEKAWKLLVHVARQPGHESLHPLLIGRKTVRKAVIVLVSSDRGLAGSYNVNILRAAEEFSRNLKIPVTFVAVGRKGRDMLYRRKYDVQAEFSDLPTAPSYADLSAIGKLVVGDFLLGSCDQVYLAYTDFQSLSHQSTVIRKLLPLDVEYGDGRVKSYNITHHKTNAVFIYEPDQKEILDIIVPRFTALQIYQAILTSQASEHAARMLAMRNATDNASDLVDSLTLEYNKARQQAITSEMLDISGGAEALIHEH